MATDGLTVERDALQSLEPTITCDQWPLSPEEIEAATVLVRCHRNIGTDHPQICWDARRTRYRIVWSVDGDDRMTDGHGSPLAAWQAYLDTPEGR